MCLYPTIIANKRYKPTRKNGLNPPICTDERMLVIPAKCGKCYECRKEKSREWRIRMIEELRTSFGYFVTLTISNEGFKELCEKIGLPLDSNENTIATKAIRWFLERVRKDTGKSIKHWFVTELGEDNDRLHLHGILFDQKAIELTRKHWKYGHIFVGSYCNERTVNYITKYMLKYDVKHKDYTQIVLCSKGLGIGYLDRSDGWRQKDFVYCKKVPHYQFRNGKKVPMPKYYVEKIFTEDERLQMWKNILDSGETYVHGEKVNMDDIHTINNLREYYRNRFIQCTGDNKADWDQQKAIRKEERWRREMIAPKREFEGVMMTEREIRRIKADRKAGVDTHARWTHWAVKGVPAEKEREKRRRREEKELREAMERDSLEWCYGLGQSSWGNLNKSLTGMPF